MSALLGAPAQVADRLPAVAPKSFREGNARRALREIVVLALLAALWALVGALIVEPEHCRPKSMGADQHRNTVTGCHDQYKPYPPHDPRELSRSVVGKSLSASLRDASARLLYHCLDVALDLSQRAGVELPPAHWRARLGCFVGLAALARHKGSLMLRIADVYARGRSYVRVEFIAENGGGPGVRLRKGTSDRSEVGKRPNGLNA